MDKDMTEAKLRVKIGEHEFDATGPAETVEQYFQSFKQLISGSSALASAKEPKTTPFHKLVQLNGRTAFLKVAPKPEEAVLLVLLAQKRFLNNESVSGMEIMSGLRHSGIRIRRGDQILARHARDGSVSVIGSNKKRRYGLTDAGVKRAEEIVQSLLSMSG
jgi:hypothetical protein